MNFLYKTLIFLYFLFSNAYPQFYADSVVSDYVIEFMKIADESITYRSEYKNPKEFAEGELEHIAELYFYCYDKDPVGFYGYIEEKSKDLYKQYLDSRKPPEEMMPWGKVYYLRNQIANKYGIPFTEVISTPAILRCKYVDDNLSFLDTARVISTAMKVYFYFVIEDILNGNKFFNIGDTIVINSVIGGPDNPRPIFEKTKSFLIPIKPFILDISKYSGEISFNYLHSVYDVWVMGKPPKTFPIIDEKITDCEYFGIKDTSWTYFKKYFNETFLIFN
jgi:hypothetical protein